MSSNLAALLPQIAPTAIEWATRFSRMANPRGVPLIAPHIELARTVGVQHPEFIRICLVDQIPLPEDPLIQSAASQVRLVQSNMAGLTLGYTVFIRATVQADIRLLSHEFRHVAQYEACGGIAQFLAVHLGHLVAFGYEDSPFEVDARAHEIHGP